MAAATKPKKTSIVPPLNLQGLPGISPVPEDYSPPSPALAISDRDIHNRPKNQAAKIADGEQARVSLQEMFERASDEKVPAGHSAKIREPQFRKLIQSLVTNSAVVEGNASALFQLADRADSSSITFQEFLDAIPQCIDDDRFAKLSISVDAARPFFDAVVEAAPARLARKNQRKDLDAQLRYIFEKFGKSKPGFMVKEELGAFIHNDGASTPTAVPRPSPQSASHASVGLKPAMLGDDVEALWLLAKASPAASLPSAGKEDSISYDEFRMAICDVSRFCADEESHQALLAKIVKLAPTDAIKKSRCCGRESGNGGNCIIL